MKQMLGYLTRPKIAIPEPHLNKNSGHMDWPELDPDPNLPNSYPKI